MSNEITEKLKQSSADLLMMSESDYPFEVFLWTAQANNLTTQELLRLTGYPQDSPVEEVTLDYFFRNCAYEQEWHDEQQKQNVKKFQTLVQTLKENLNEIKVYRIGTIDINVYITGRTPSGDIAGLSTKVVET
ncbi:MULTISPECIES: nuclease A inhibitor family protein [unclassified Nostoc]|uniref:nuclease A inhibitor family protein n=1 Tax=unclassified Nostoc TaxID=2593658 RepID=UPI002AD1F5DB|nr:nuclease A inhibitor family protein [Nostoc sp. ChiQUE02]MDZ8230161.1 nuclease A inhibitor family protein [Nostoc sp. ChiQUE02]